MVSHLATGSWAGAWCTDWRGWSDDSQLVGGIDECDCLKCLQAVKDLGDQAHERRMVLNVEHINRLMERVKP